MAGTVGVEPTPFRVTGGRSAVELHAIGGSGWIGTLASPARTLCVCQRFALRMHHRRAGVDSLRSPFGRNACVCRRFAPRCNRPLYLTELPIRKSSPAGAGSYGAWVTCRSTARGATAIGGESRSRTCRAVWAAALQAAYLASECLSWSHIFLSCLTALEDDRAQRSIANVTPPGRWHSGAKNLELMMSLDLTTCCLQDSCSAI